MLHVLIRGHPFLRFLRDSASGSSSSFTHGSRTTTTLLLFVLLLSLVLLLLLHLPLLPLAVLAHHGFGNRIAFDACRAVSQVLSSVFWFARAFCRSALHELVAGGAIGVDKVFDTHLSL